MTSNSNDKSGKQSSKPQSGNQQSDKQQADKPSGTRQPSGGTQGGKHEQNIDAGRQSHKNDGTSNLLRNKWVWAGAPVNNRVRAPVRVAARMISKRKRDVKATRMMTNPDSRIV